MESQIQDLRNRLGGDQAVCDWLGKAILHENLAIGELKRAGLDHLATPSGLRLIKDELFPYCPNSLRKDH